jgi:N-carbamoylputrescine amidase
MLIHQLLPDGPKVRQARHDMERSHAVEVEIAHAIRAPYQVALVQMAMSGDPAANLDAGLREGPRSGQPRRQGRVSARAFPHALFLPEGGPSLFALAEAIPGPSTEALGWEARRSSVVVVASLFERRAPGLYHNTTAVIGTDGSILGLYRKMHIPDDPAYYEKFYFTPGDLGFRVFPPSSATLACSSAGTSGFPRPPDWWPCAGPT